MRTDEREMTVCSECPMDALGIEALEKPLRYWFGLMVQPLKPAQVHRL